MPSRIYLNICQRIEKKIYFTPLRTFSTVNLLTMSYGMCSGWTSPSNLLLTSDDTPLPSGKITMDEFSSVAAFSLFGGMMGNIFFGFFDFGRKIPLLLMAIPIIIGWLLILYAQNLYYLYAARILIGFVGGGVFILIPLFLSEIASDRIRGTLGSLLMSINSFGMLVSYILGNYCDISIIPKVAIAISILYVCLIITFPETPLTLIKNNKVSDAEKSIRFYQNLDKNNYDEIQTEINGMKAALNVATESFVEKEFDWSYILKRPASKAMAIGVFMVVLDQFSGCCAMTYYTAEIFKLSGSNMTENKSAIVVGTIQLLGSFTATYLVDRAGRKFLYAVSTIGTALGLITLGVYTMLKSWQYDLEAVNWIPVAGFSFVIFIASWGIMTLPFMVIAEIMPEKVKDYGMSFCMTLDWFFAFIAIKFLPFIIDALQFHGTMFLFTVVCVISTFIIIVFIPETKGKSYVQIMDSLR